MKCSFPTESPQPSLKRPGTGIAPYCLCADVSVLLDAKALPTLVWRYFPKFLQNILINYYVQIKYCMVSFFLLKFQCMEISVQMYIFRDGAKVENFYFWLDWIYGVPESFLLGKSQTMNLKYFLINKRLPLMLKRCIPQHISLSSRSCWRQRNRISSKVLWVLIK